jgi:hypothetical protein
VIILRTFHFTLWELVFVTFEFGGDALICILMLKDGEGNRTPSCIELGI